jgi:hypothetical protein
MGGSRHACQRGPWMEQPPSRLRSPPLGPGMRSGARSPVPRDLPLLEFGVPPRAPSSGMYGGCAALAECLSAVCARAWTVRGKHSSRMTHAVVLGRSDDRGRSTPDLPGGPGAAPAEAALTRVRDVAARRGAPRLLGRTHLHHRCHHPFRRRVAEGSAGDDPRRPLELTACDCELVITLDPGASPALDGSDPLPSQIAPSVSGSVDAVLTGSSVARLNSRGSSARPGRRRQPGRPSPRGLWPPGRTLPSPSSPTGSSPSVTGWRRTL